MEERITDTEWLTLAYAIKAAQDALAARVRADELAPAIAVAEAVRDRIFAAYDLGPNDAITDGVIHRAALPERHIIQTNGTEPVILGRS